MSIEEFIRNKILHPRLKQAGCLVVYDPEKRYQALCQQMATDTIKVVDASASSIVSREEALQGLRDLGQANSGLQGLLVYVPAPRPETDEQKQIDPFALYTTCGAVFPKDDGDEYLSLCLRAKPDHATEIRRVFADSPTAPAFAVIDTIGGGVHWPQLRATLKEESAREILFALMAPQEKQLQALKEQEGWVQESRDFLKSTLMMSVKTRAKSWSPLSDELWRYVLFSEFVFDLPVPLPEKLSGVPRAEVEARPIIEEICERLRQDPRTRSEYIERAEIIEKELNLVELCQGIQDLGERDTFPFEERTFLKVAIKGIASHDADLTRKILQRRQYSVWLGKGENQAQWELVRSGLGLIECCDDLERQLPEYSRSQTELLDFYIGHLREADRLQREFEQAVGDFLDPQGLMENVLSQARLRYSRLTGKAQSLFIKHLETTGWPAPGRLANADIFDRMIADRLTEKGRKTAYILVDALRYELGVVLEKQLSEDGPVELQAAYAQLPSITLVGMASLLPGALSELSLKLVNDSLTPYLGDSPVSNVKQRMNVFKKRLGDRFDETLLSDFVKSKPKIAETVDLLVLRSTEIDSHLESNPESTLGLISITLKQIRHALHKLKGLGFKEAVIVTDHGFVLNAHAEAGDVCRKPQGQWPITTHDRMMLGHGSSDMHNMVMNTEKLGIRGDFSQAAFPRSMAPYRSGHLYFHGGISLQEAVVPVLLVKLDTEKAPELVQEKIEISYKNGAKRITTRLPVVEIYLRADQLFSQGINLDVLLEAQDSKGNVVGEPRPGEGVNPATRTINLIAGERRNVVLAMDREYEGKFTVKVLNPSTLASFCTLQLETDYTV